MEPRSSVFICALPRTGSALVGHLLGANGFGYFAEWFWREDMERNREAWGTTNWPDCLASVLEHGTSERGVFGAKVMWGYLHELMFELRRMSREYEADDLAVLSRFFPQPRFVWVRREDVVLQAVSWAKAVQTGQWAANQRATGAPNFDFEQIDALYHVARVHEGAWRRWFDAHRIEPLRIVYEELCSDPERVMLDALSFLGLEPDAEPLVEPPPELVEQGNRVNNDWAARYRRLAGL